MKINKNYQALGKDYLFSEVAHRVAIFQEGHPEAKVIRAGHWPTRPSGTPI